jgi:hypothetical protein
MAKCAKCGGKFSIWSSEHKAPAFICNACCPSEMQIQDDIQQHGLSALAKRYLPDITLTAIGLARWKTLSDSVSGLFGRVIAMGLGGITGGILTSSFKPQPAGLVATSSTELFVVELKTLTNPNDAFDWKNLRDLSLPAHYNKNRSIILAKPKSVPLESIRAEFNLAGGDAEVTISGQWSTKLCFPASYAAENSDMARAIFDAISIKKA